MLHVLFVRYTAPLDQVTPHVPGHVAYLERWHADGTFLLSGQTVPDDLGGVILARGAREHVEEVAAGDPFAVAGVAAYEIVTVDPGRGHEQLRELITGGREGAPRPR
ncbi:YciI family protein [Nonomuraea insulae]|uniref:YciI family protein n=1 Tax=Nonomuraea insulae TaxID=1616787 RepID=A0ABW1CF95_9ACTN